MWMAYSETRTSTMSTVNGYIHLQIRERENEKAIEKERKLISLCEKIDHLDCNYV